MGSGSTLWCWRWRCAAKARGHGTSMARALSTGQQLQGWLLAVMLITACSAVSQVRASPSSDCISSATPVNHSLNGFFDLSSRRAFRWKLTSSKEAEKAIGSADVLSAVGINLHGRDYVTLVSTPMQADSQLTACSASFSYKLVGGHLSVKQLVAGKFMEIWCETVQHAGWRTINVRLHYTKKLRVFFNVTPLDFSSTVTASLGGISIQCCRELSGCIYYPSPDFRCGMAGFQALSALSSLPEVSWRRKATKGRMQFASTPGQHASMISPLYWWHSRRQAQCLVQFQSESVITEETNHKLVVPLGRMSMSIYGMNPVLWETSFTKLALRSRHKQRFFSMATAGPFKLLLNASAQQPGIAITMEGISVHCCPVSSLTNPTSVVQPAEAGNSSAPESTSVPTRTSPPQDTPTIGADTTSTRPPDDVVSSDSDDTSLRENDQQPTDLGFQVKAALIPMGCVAFVLLIIIGVFCCKRQVPSPSSNSSGSNDGLRRPFQSSLNNPGYEETIPVLQRVSRQNSDALGGANRTASNDAVQSHAYENNALKGHGKIEEQPAPSRKPGRVSYENTPLPAKNGVQVHRRVGYENSSQHSGETLPLGQGNVTPSRQPENFYDRLDSATSDPLYSQPFVQPPCTADDLYSHLAEREYLRIDAQSICLRHKIGSGHFADVHRGEWKVGNETKLVAVKTLKSGASVETKTRFLRESAIMAQFNHLNIVRLFGVVVQGDPMMLILELMTSNLQEHLHTLRSRNYNQQLQVHLLSVCRQIASGMEYLAGRSFVHRDLAARNVMVDPGGVCKIGDFGMARDISADQVYVSGNERVFPIKWTAPEAIEYIQFTTSSDCWSYGVTLYEIWSLGEKPYGDWTNEEVFRKVKGGYRLKSPKKCPHTLYYLMLQCWQAVEKNRPTFTEVVQCLSDSDESLLAF